MITYPLNNIEYSAEDAELFHVTRTSGVYANNSFNYSLIGGNDIEIGSGIAWIKNSEFAGKVVAEKKPTVINMGITDAVYPRIDAVVIQFNAETNETTFVVKQGALATDPVAPEVIRTSNIYELHLYHILRPAGAVSLSAADITDMRLLPEYCGIMADSVTSVDTTAIQQQIDAFIENARSQTSSFIDEARSETQELISNTSTAVENLANETEQKYNEAQDDIDKLISDTEERLDDIAANVKANVETDATVPSVKDVPENSLPYAEVVEIGGMTYRVNVGTDEAPQYVLRSALVEEVESVGVNRLPEDSVVVGQYWDTDGNGGVALRYNPDLMCATDPLPLKHNTTYCVSSALDGAMTSWAVWFVDENYKSLGRTDGWIAPGLTFTTPNAFSYALFTAWYSGEIYQNDIMIIEGTTAKPYTPYVRNTLPIPDAVQALDGYGEGNPDDITEYNAIIWNADGSVSYSHKGNIVDNAWVALGTPEVTDISDLFPADNLIGVEGGGTVTMVNEYGYDVPNTIVFYESTNEVIGADTLVGNLVGTAARAKVSLDVPDWAKENTKPAYTASEIGAGTFSGQVIANASGQPAGVSCVRNSKCSFDESVLPTVEGESVWYLE